MEIEIVDVIVISICVVSVAYGIYREIKNNKKSFDSYSYYGKFRPYTISDPVSMGILPAGSGEPTAEELGIDNMIPFDIEMSYNSKDAEIPDKLFELSSKYIMEQLQKGIHPDEIEFNLVDFIADIIDQYATDEDGNRISLGEKV